MVRYRAGSERGELPMTGDGQAFQAILPGNLAGDTLHYALLAEGQDGLTTVRKYEAPLVRTFLAPRIINASGPQTWSRDSELTLSATVQNGECAREVRLHYREADQNRAFRMATQPGGRAGDHEFRVDAHYLDDAYELIYYWEIVDVLGGGSFYPDPWSVARYHICPPARRPNRRKGHRRP
jgi:hypothetical protein